MKKEKISYTYSWRYNNTFEVLVDGTSYFSSMLNAIKAAKHNILLEQYLFESGHIASAFIVELCNAKKRGLEVIVLLDEYGSSALSDKDKSTLTKHDIQLVLYNPVSFYHLAKSLKRDHRKLLSIDNKVAFIGGAGITDEFSPEANDNYWHDVMLKIKGDSVDDLNHSFYEVCDSRQVIPEKTKTIHHADITNKSRVLISSGAQKNEITRSIIKHIRSSKNRIWLTSPYFISSWKIRRALRFAASKGVDVKLLFPGTISDHKWVSYGIRRYYQRLLRAGISVYEFQPRFTHAKIILCDDYYSIGSSNFDRWNQFLNLDINIEVYDKESHEEITKLFEANFLNSELIALHKWKKRSFLHHVNEAVSGIIIKILGYIIQRFKR